MRSFAIVAGIAASMTCAPAGRAQSASGVTPVGTVLLAFDGRAVTPPDVVARTAAATERRYAFRYVPTTEIAQYNPLNLAWTLRFGTVEDPSTHVRWLRDVKMTLDQNTDMQCSAITSDLVVGADKVSRPSDAVHSGMMVTVSVRCTRARDHYIAGCGGSLNADGSRPNSCNPTPVTP